MIHKDFTFNVQYLNFHLYIFCSTSYLY